MLLKTAIAAVCLAMVTMAASAQSFETYQQREADLAALSAVFGEMHHIRRLCEPRREDDIWRDRMKQLVELEEPQPAARNRMVASFNKAYRSAQGRFIGCDRRARDYAAARASQGDVIIARLTAPLYEAMNEDNGASFIWRGADAPIINPDTD